VKRAATDDLRGGDRDENLSIANAVLAGARGPHRDIVLVNAAAALVAAGKAETFLEGMALGVISIDTGAARAKVTALAEY
jgi:anthranilate phosphoribosyltransferase